MSEALVGTNFPQFVDNLINRSRFFLFQILIQGARNPYSASRTEWNGEKMGGFGGGNGRSRVRFWADKTPAMPMA